MTLEVNLLPGQGHPAVPFDPGGLEVGNDLQHGLADDVGRTEPGQPLEGGIHRQESVVARLAVIVEDDLVNGQAVQHLAEEEVMFLLGGEQELPLFLFPLLGLLALGDVSQDDLVGQPPAELDPGGAGRDGDELSIRSDCPDIAGRQRGPGHYFAEPSLDELTVVGMDEVERILPDQLLGEPTPKSRAAAGLAKTFLSSTVTRIASGLRSTRFL